MAGLDKELGRLEREERLVRKFTDENTVYSGGSSRAPPASTATNNKSEEEDVAMEYVKMTKEDAADDNITTATMKRENDDDEEDWEEAEATPSPSKKKASLTDDSQDLREKIAQKWASSTISRIAKADARVETPVGALGLALHTALLELTAVINQQGNKKTEQMFRCTGVPDEAIISQFLGKANMKKSGEGGGFAPPIRELPKGVLIPSNWEDMAKKQQDAQLIAFRYKCGQDVFTTSSGPTNDCTTLYLVLQVQNSEVRVSFGLPASTKGIDVTATTTSNQLQLPLTQHINLDGFQASKSKSSLAVQPSLFFISLSELLLHFGSTFGLLSVMQSTFGEGTLATEEVGVVDTDMDMMPANMKDFSNDDDMFVNQAAVKNDSKVVPRPNIPPDGPAVDMPSDTNDPLRVRDSRTGMMGRRGDFEGDLLPGGIQTGLPGGPPPFGGSQVGPNHPMFDDEDNLYNNPDDFGGAYGPPSFGIPGVGGGNMGSMRPRFDPYGPPGGPTEPGRGGRGGRGRGRFGSGRGRGGRGRGMPPGGFGDPNNDHMQPPNSDYFS